MKVHGTREDLAGPVNTWVLKVTGDLDEIEALRSIVEEFVSATNKFGAFNSAHEGYAVILEEVDELWDEVKLKERNDNQMFVEAKQAGAMALRFLIDIGRKVANG